MTQLRADIIVRRPDGTHYVITPDGKRRDDWQRMGAPAFTPSELLGVTRDNAEAILKTKRVLGGRVMP